LLTSEVILQLLHDDDDDDDFHLWPGTAVHL